MNLTTTTQIRRHKDVVAFKNATGELYAFHARNLQVAEISDDLWNEMPETTFALGASVAIPKTAGNTASQNLRDWEGSFGTAQLLSKTRNKFNLTLNVTQLCNLHCHYCAAGGDGTYGDPVQQISIQKTLPQIDLLMNRLTEGGEFHITFLGGEPLMYPQIIKAIGEYTRTQALAKKIHTDFQIITNGTLITDEVLNFISTIKPTITLSLDGPAEINDQQRPQKNGSSSTASAIRGLQTLLKRKSEFGAILLHAVFNRQHTDVEKVWDFFAQFDVDKMEFTFDVTEKDESANLQFIESLKRTAKKAVMKGGERELRRLQLFDIYFSQLDAQYLKENHCGTGKSLLSLDSRNKLYQCPLEVSFKERQVGEGTQVNWKSLAALEKPLIELNQCGSCWARHMCGGGCLFNHESLTGDKHTKHPSYCFRTRHLLSEVFLYYKTFREME